LEKSQAVSIKKRNDNIASRAESRKNKRLGIKDKTKPKGKGRPGFEGGKKGKGGGGDKGGSGGKDGGKGASGKK